jgi:thiol-disulfide isomerase/thioredoxin
MNLSRMALILAGSLTLSAQTSDSVARQAEEQKEQTELNQIVTESNNSPFDLIHAYEQFLGRHPNSAQRTVLEKAMAQYAVEINDSARIVVYGQKVLEREKPDDMNLIDRVTRALLNGDDAEKARRALPLAVRYAKDVDELRPAAPRGHLTPGQWTDELDHAKARALILEARALGDTGNPEDAARTAVRSWQACPTGDGAREAGHWFAQLNRTADAIEYLADAFTLEDSRTTETDRAADRLRLGELYRKAHGSETGLGDTILAAYDRMAALAREREAGLTKIDPNVQAADIMQFRLPGLEGAEPVSLASLKGKTLVLDFWATWCAPCRVQRPMIEEVRKRYEDRPDVVFLAIDADDDPAVVKDFLKDTGWKGTFYFEGGLAHYLTVAQLPTIIVLDSNGRIYSRMTGFIPERFEGMLAQRIDAARSAGGQ